jgi:diguanylate cyclase (GGDEF)-like protein
MSTTDLLNRVSLFHALAQEDLQRIADAAENVEFDEGQNIVEAGDSGTALYILMDGTVQVLYPGRESDVELAMLGAGDFFGEMALLNGKPRSATVRAHTHVHLLKVEQGEFRKLIVESPRVAIQLLEILSLRIRTADEQIGGLSDQAQRDPLTRLLNRRALQERLTEECDRHRRYGGVFSLIMLDLDRFKEINELFGEGVGDATLAWIGRLLIEHTRSSDVSFRIGGEEFAILCPSTVGDSARYVAQRLVELVAQARPPVSFDLKVTVSAGLVVCPSHGLQADDLISAGEKALLQAKKEGRNRVFAPVEPRLP